MFHPTLKFMMGSFVKYVSSHACFEGTRGGNPYEPTGIMKSNKERFTTDIMGILMNRKVYKLGPFQS